MLDAHKTLLIESAKEDRKKQHFLSFLVHVTLQIILCSIDNNIYLFLQIDKDWRGTSSSGIHFIKHTIWMLIISQIHVVGRQLRTGFWWIIIWLSRTAFIGVSFEVFFNSVRCIFCKLQPNTSLRYSTTIDENKYLQKDNKSSSILPYPNVLTMKN